MIKNAGLWLPAYLSDLISRPFRKRNDALSTRHILFTICDHYEPYWGNADDRTAYLRVKSWVDHYQAIASRHTDSFGNHPKHCFFYPEEEYRKDLLEMIGGICRNGLGEVEIHLHHDNDTSDNLRKTLLNFKQKLFHEHGLLSVDKETGDIRYGFIHGNWALDNSRPDGRWCGVNDEISILQETGCYADFTMPSAPSNTQTRTINSIYYAIDDPGKPKSHDKGVSSLAGVKNNSGLLCIQGPLCLNGRSRKFGIVPRIENGRLARNVGTGSDRVCLWRNCNITVAGREDIIFIKLYGHGAQEKDIDFLLTNKGLDSLFKSVKTFCLVNGFQLHYVSARNMYNIVKGLEENSYAQPDELYDFKLGLCSR
jgi:hypothetical protein